MFALPLALLALLAPASLAAVGQPGFARHHATSDGAMQSSLEASLAAGGVAQSRALAGALLGLGLPSARDVRLLNVPEQLELAESLRAAGVDLGSRSRLRRLSEEGGEGIGDLNGGSNVRTSYRCSPDKLDAMHAKNSGFSIMSEMSTWALKNARLPVTRVTQDETFPRQLQQGGGGGSMDSIALAITALLGIASYFVQAKISRDAERSQKDSDRAHADNARAEGKAEKLLARVQVGRAPAAPTLDVVAPFTL